MEDSHIPSGALPDPRPSEEKQKDWTHQEVLGGGILDWKKLVPITLDIRKQSVSTSCGAQSLAKALTSFTGTICSALPPFDSRSNFPDQGMYLNDVGSIALKIGTGSEKDYPSQNMTDVQLNALKTPYSALQYRIGAYYTIETDIDTIATALDKGHSVILGVFSNLEEWQAVPDFKGGKTIFSHFVVCHSKNYGLFEGLKVLCVDDSCNLFSTYNQTGQRFITEDFLKHRVWGALGLIPVTETVMTKPHFKFATDLSFGMKNDDVKMLQNCLKWEGFFSKDIESTGLFGPATKAAVIKFQEKYKDFILVPAGLTHGTGYIGQHSREMLNQLFGSSL